MIWDRKIQTRSKFRTSYSLIGCTYQSTNKIMSDDWVLYYYGGFPGRGEFIRLIFEEAGVKYREVNEYKTLRSQINQGEGDFFPHFAPPMIKNGDFTLSQAHVATRYLGEKFGLTPDSEKDKMHAEQINLTCHDYIAEGRLSFHAIESVGPYKSQAKETQPFIDKFVSKRLPTWFKYFERALSANNGGSGFVIGNKCTFVDLTLFHILRATEAQWPTTWKEMDYIPNLKVFKERMAARPNIQAYLKSNRAQPFAGDSLM